MELAKKIAGKDNTSAIAELMDLLESGPSPMRHDAIKVLYEAGEIKPGLLLPYHQTFLRLLGHKDNRMKWGAMCALSAISRGNPATLVPHLPLILDAMDSGTVITRDHGIYILCHVARIKKHHADVMELMLEQIDKAPVNQVPMYAEKMAEVITPAFTDRLVHILQSRKDVLAIPSKQKRIDKLIRQLQPKK